MFHLSDSKFALTFQGYHEINGIGKSTCQNLCFFSFFFFFSLLACRTRRSRVGAVSEPRRSHVGAVSENREKKKKRDTAGHRNPARRTRSGVQHVSDTDTTPKMACPCNLDSSLTLRSQFHEVRQLESSLFVDATCKAQMVLVTDFSAKLGSQLFFLVQTVCKQDQAMYFNSIDCKNSPLDQ